MMDTEPLGWTLTCIALSIILLMFLKVYLKDRRKRRKLDGIRPSHS